MEGDKKDGLGDKVEKAIKFIAPKTHSRKRNCRKCRKRKQDLNELGDKLWPTKK
tara:strand:- start:567 stop:728 length:162 start_codon:yes stop_codon:yes gene_type:complete